MGEKHESVEDLVAIDVERFADHRDDQEKYCDLDKEEDYAEEDQIQEELLINSEVA